MLPLLTSFDRVTTCIAIKLRISVERVIIFALDVPGIVSAAYVMIANKQVRYSRALLSVDKYFYLFCKISVTCDLHSQVIEVHQLLNVWMKFFLYRLSCHNLKTMCKDFLLICSVIRIMN